MNAVDNFMQMSMNSRANMPLILMSRGMEKYPRQERVIICAPGPSLQRFLEEYEPSPSDHIISTSRAAKSLIKNNIFPHSIIHIDFQEKYFSFIEDLDLSNINLILGDSCPAPFYDKPCLERWSYRNSLNPVTLEVALKVKQFGYRPSIDSIGSVSADALQLAITTGAKQIIVTGQDGCLANGFYYDGEEYPVDPQVETQILGQNKKMLRTTVVYVQFIDRFRLIAKTCKSVAPDMQFINFSPGGAFIEGWDHVEHWDQIKHQ